jgi:hypothetical protein
MTRLLTLVLGLALAAPPVMAQDAGPTSKPLVKYGKWLLAAGAVGMNLLAAQAHNHADDHFNALEQRCFENQTACDLDASGAYADPVSEALYQESLSYDREARAWLFGGETALVAAGAMFVWELTRHTPKPDNIPFEPEVRSLRQATGIGIKIEF